MTITAQKYRANTISLRSELAELHFLIGDSAAADHALSPLRTPQKELIEICGTDPSEITAFVRACTIMAFVKAEHGFVTDAIASIDQAFEMLQNRGSSVRARFTFANAKSHILFLSGSFSEANAVLTAYRDNENLLPNDLNLRVTVEHNLVICRLNSDFLVPPREALRSNNNYQDIKRLTGVRIGSPEDMLAAIKAQQDGKHVDALPGFWRELTASWEEGDWSRYWEAEANIAKECALLGWYPLAIQHAIRSHSGPLAEKICTAFLASLPTEISLHDTYRQVVRDAVSRTMLSKLDQHFLVAAKVIESLADALPNDTISQVFDFLLPNANVHSNRFSHDASVARAAWTALTAISFHLSNPEATILLARANELDLVNVDASLLQDVLRTISGVTRLFSEDQLSEVTDFAIPFAEGYSKSMDHQIYYRQALSIVEQVCYRGSEAVRNAVALRLFPSGAFCLEPLKTRIVSLFNAVSFEEGWLDRIALSTAETIRRQAQKLSEEDTVPPSPPGTLMYQETTYNGVRSITYLISDNVDVTPILLQNLDRLSTGAFESYVSALVDMASCTFNIPSNRIGLLEALADFSHKMSSKTQAAVRALIVPIVRNENDGEFYASLKEHHLDSPLNPYRANFGSPANLRGAALRFLVELMPEVDEENASETSYLLTSALMSSDAELRHAAAVATQHTRYLDDTLFTSLLWGMRDPDSSVAIACFWSLAGKTPIPLDPFKAEMLFAALKFASNARNADLRRAAGALISQLPKWSIDQLDLLSRIDEIRSVLSDDLSFSVRNIFVEAEASDQSPDLSSDLRVESPVDLDTID